jgi:hypothetical protein
MVGNPPQALPFQRSSTILAHARAAQLRSQLRAQTVWTPDLAPPSLVRGIGGQASSRNGLIAGVTSMVDTTPTPGRLASGGSIQAGFSGGRT